MWVRFLSTFGGAFGWNLLGGKLRHAFRRTPPVGSQPPAHPGTQRLRARGF
jgi:hypothetical protein